jgi:hypothetical protein
MKRDKCECDEPRINVKSRNVLGFTVSAVCRDCRGIISAKQTMERRRIINRCRKLIGIAFEDFSVDPKEGIRDRMLDCLYKPIIISPVLGYKDGV